MSKRAPTMRELVLRAVVRKYIDSEWMSKMSAKEYVAWEEGERMTMTICKYPKYEHDAKLLEQIMFKEMEYKLRKEQIEKEEKIIRDGADGLIVSNDNGITKPDGKNICLGGELTHDIVSSPGTRNAVIRHDKYEPVTGTTYQTIYGKVRGINSMNNRTYPDEINWGDYEKHVKNMDSD